MSQVITRAQRRELERTNAKWPVLPQDVPKEHWPVPREGQESPIRVLRGRDFLVQVYEAPAPADVRLSVLRTSVNKQSSDWEQGITWDQLQWLKDVCGYHGRDAVEVFPATWDVVNVANIRHLWVMRDPLAFAWRKQVVPA